MTEFGLVGRTGSDRSRLESGNDAVRGTPRHGTRLTVGKRVTSTPARSRKPTCVGKRREQPRPTTNRPPRPGRSCLPGSKQPEVATRSGVVHRVARIRCFDARETTTTRHSMPGLAVRRHRVATFYCFNCHTADLDPTSTPTPNRNVQIAPSDTSADCAYHHQNALRSGETPEHHIYDAHPLTTAAESVGRTVPCHRRSGSRSFQ